MFQFVGGAHRYEALAALCRFLISYYLILQICQIVHSELVFSAAYRQHYAESECIMSHEFNNECNIKCKSWS